MLRIGTSRGGSRAAGLKAVALALLLSASPLSIDAALAQQGQAAANRSFSIPAGPLSSALVAFGQQAGIQVSYVPSVAAGLTSPGIAGTMPPNAALARLLSGTGLSFQRSGANTVVISNAAGNTATATVDGAIALDTIDVSGGGGEGGTVYTPYETAAP
ncbi:MAG: STN domain-containing protein, partial [Hyphomicrobiaceae bacterium]